MENGNMELIIMDLVVNSGNARSLCMEAIHLAAEGMFDEANTKLEEGGKTLAATHQLQIDIIQKEAAGEHMPVQLLMVHAQDHLMNAMTVYDLAKEIIVLTKMVVSK